MSFLLPILLNRLRVIKNCIVHSMNSTLTTIFHFQFFFNNFVRNYAFTSEISTVIHDDHIGNISIFQRIQLTGTGDIKDWMWNQERSISPQFHFHFRQIFSIYYVLISTTCARFYTPYTTREVPQLKCQ